MGNGMACTIKWLFFRAVDKIVLFSVLFSFIFICIFKISYAYVIDMISRLTLYTPYANPFKSSPN